MTLRTGNAAILTVCVMCAGCMSWKGGWTVDAGPPKAGADPVALVAAAEALGPQANTLAGLRADIRAWEAVLAADPANERAMLRLASDYTLLGVAHAESVGQSGEFWRNALQYAERAMALDDAFRARVQAGAEVWEAVEVLGPDRAEALVRWLDAVRFYFQFGQSGVVRMTNPKWPDRMDRVVDRLEAMGVRPASVAVARGYVAMARSNGKDVAAAREQFDQAVALAPDCIKPRWARVKFLAVPAELEELAIEDLEWLLAQDPAGKGTPEWNAFFQADGRRMLGALR